MTTVAAPALEARAALSRLIAKVAKGDRNALQGIYEKTSAKLFGVILRILPTRDEAEEILQDVYLTVWLKAPQFDQERGSPITWLATIARNKAIDRRRSLRSYGEELSDTLIDSIPDGGPTALQEIEWSQDRERLFACLDTLEHRLKSALSEAFLNGHTYIELADHYNVPLGTMKSWMRRGLLKMRDCLSS
jgi:RNA polymerase sigma factor (sigma-70 family)